MRALSECSTDGWYGPQRCVRCRCRKAGNTIANRKHQTGAIIANEV
jgi:hypothetical protein